MQKVKKNSAVAPHVAPFPKKPRKSGATGPAVPKKARSVTTRPPVERMLNIYNALKQGTFPNCVKLAKEFRFSVKTISRDMDFMRSRMNLPIAYDPKRHGFYFTRDDVKFPTMDITSGELVALTVARISIERYRGTSFEPFLRSAFAKLTEQLSDEISFGWQELDDLISFRGPGLEVQMNPEVFQPVFDALIAREEIRFLHCKATETEPQERHVRPYHLICTRYGGYLICYDLHRDDARTFALSRMSQVRRLNTTFVPPPQSEILERITHSVGVYGGTPERVRLRLSDLGAKFLREDPLHPEQKIVVGEDGRPELVMEVAINPELEHSILRWGMLVEVLEPKRLRDALLEHARAIVARG
ncbi:MAG: WYL domain-containing protein [Verrucomicrobiaceae bacterium]|nr:MAG: WYL domain-containing protein [Verrucomicrobiaceae bacterium]